MNRYNLPLTWHAVTEMSAIGWVMIAYNTTCLRSPLWLASIAEGDSIINATLIYFTYCDTYIFNFRITPFLSLFQIYALNAVMKELENKNFKEFCEKNGISTIF